MTETRWEFDKVLGSNYLNVSNELITTYVEFIKSAKKEDIENLFKAIEFDWKYFHGDLE